MRTMRIKPAVGVVYYGVGYGRQGILGGIRCNAYAISLSGIYRSANCACSVRRDMALVTYYTRPNYYKWYFCMDKNVKTGSKRMFYIRHRVKM